MRESIRVAALSMMLVLSVASPLLAGSAAGAPSGFVGVPNEQVTEDLPSDYSGEIFVEDLRGETMASSNASSMDVILTTPERAETYLGSNGSVVGRNGVAIVLRDDQNSAGREVALPAAPIRDAFGTVPEQVYGVSSEGDEWSSQTRIEDGSVIFEVPHFSTNTVTFSGTTEITADPATDGSSFSYELADLDSASDPVVNLTGVTSQATESRDYLGNISTTISPAGDVSNATITVKGLGDGDRVAKDIGYFESTSYSGYIGKARVRGFNGDNDRDRTAYLQPVVDGETPVPEKTVNIPPDTDGEATFDLLVKANDYVIGSVGGRDISENGYWFYEPEKPTNTTISTGETSHNFGTLNQGETVSRNISLSPGDQNFSIASDGGVKVYLNWTETVTTSNPTIQLNSESVSYSGTLADGESTSLSFNSSALKEGTNNLSVSVGDGSLSADAPSPSVGLDYSHSSSADVSTNFSSTKWQESYNISKTFGSDRTDAELTIPFDGNVVEITNLETRTNGGSWSSADYTMDDTTVTVSLGSVSGGDTIEVRTTGLRVLTHNGAIEVIEPTVLGDDLNSKIEITDRSEGFAIETTGTTDLVHYAANPSWTAQDYYVIKGGYRALRLPESNVGSTTRVRTAPIVASTSEETELVVLDPTEPRFRIRPGSTSGADTVEVEYRDATASEPHALRSVTRETDVMVSDADSSGIVSFSTSGSDQTYIIEQRDRSSGPVVQVDDSGSSSGPLPIVATFIGIAGSMIGLVFAGRRLGLRGRTSNLLLLLGGGVIGTVGVGLVTGRSIVSDLIFALTELGRSVGSSTAGTIVIAVSILIALYLIDSRLLDLPRLVYLATGIPLALWVIETLTNGALSATFEQVGALAWLLVILGSLALLWRVLQPTIVRIGGGR